MTLEGKFFHRFKPGPAPGTVGVINHQGVVTASLGDGFYMLHFFEWISGGPSFYGRHIYHITDLAGDLWSWYDTNEDMRTAYDYGGGAPREGE
jgi:hypothetical protein